MKREHVTLISLGSGCDSTFELDFIHRTTSSIVHVLDPTITHDRFHKCLNSSKSNVGLSPNVDNLRFWKVGLSDVSQETVFARSPDERIGSMSEAKLAGYAVQSGEKMLVVDMPTLYSMLAIDGRVTFKMDIEGSEFKVIESWCMPSKKGIELPELLLVEFHERLLDASTTFGRPQAYKCLQKLGYTVVHEAEPKKEEVLFALA